MRISEQAEGRWPGILAALGVPEEFLQNKHGPCPQCGGKDRYRFDDKGRGLWYCNGCGAGDGFSLLMNMQGMSFKESARAVEGVVGTVQPSVVKQPDTQAAKDRLAKVGKMAGPVGQEVTRYLVNRKVALCDYLREIPAMPYYEDGKKQGTYPAMLGAFRGPEGEIRTMHVTYLENGAKAAVDAPKKFLPPIHKRSGGAIRLSDITDTLGIAEGIETALAVKKHIGTNCWAAGNTTMLEAFIPPLGVSAIEIYGDRDHSYAGQKSSYALAERLTREGYTVNVYLPERIGDFCDQYA